MKALPGGPENEMLRGLWGDLVVDDGICVVDLRQNIVFWSRSAQRILGYGPEEVTGRLCYEIVGGRDSRNYHFCRRNCPIVVNARRGRPTPNYDVLCPTSGADPLWLNVSTAVVKNKGRAAYVLHMFRDVSHRRHIEEFAQRVAGTLRQVLKDEPGHPIWQGEPSPPPLPKLSPRETETLRLLACGMSTRQIADSLGITPLTARNHVGRLLLKLGAETRLQAVLFASQHHLI